MTPTDSWIEISSQPSSSSASSVHDEVITHGLRVQHPSTHQRRRQMPLHLSLDRQKPDSIADSSQDEDDESESESDRVMTSSNEDAQPLRRFPPISSAAGPVGDTSSEECDDDDDENATALGVGSNTHDVFTPQPNAFSHPPSSQFRSQQQSTGSYFSAARHSAPRAASERLATAPSRAADHDAALRASLTTLLSCAAAARNQPRSNQAPSAKGASITRQRSGAYVEPSTLRMIPASEINRRRRPSSSSQRQLSASPCRSQSSETSEKNKRKALRSGSKDRRAVKRLRAAGVDEVISPTLLTWVVSAGVLVLVGALSFSAGYATGREAERVETGLSAAVSAGDCGRQSRSGLGLRRRLLGGAAHVVSV